MSKKLVQINVTCNGSTGRIMEQIQKEAISQGWEAYSFFGRGKPSNEFCYKIGNKLDVLFHVLITRLFDLQGHGSKVATKKMIKKIKQFDPDVIHLHNIHGYYLNMKVLFDYLKSCNKKIVWTLHDCWPFTGHCSHFTMSKCDKWQNGCKCCSQTKSYPKSLYVDNSEYQYKLKAKLFTGINNLTLVVPSNWLAELVKESFLSEYDIKVINNGIDLSIFKPTNVILVRERYNIPSNKKIILGVASVWNISKGLEEFVKLSKIIDEDKIIVLVGLNKKQIKALPNNIIGIERTESIEELANLYSNAYVFVNPTLEDNFPTTNLEALACGTAVVTYNTGGSIESIDGNCGIIVNKHDIVSLNASINNIQSFSSNDCLKRSKEYDNNKIYKKYLYMYESV